MVDVRPGTPRTQRYRVFDTALAMRDREAAAITASATTAGIEFPVRQHFDFKCLIDYAITLGVASATTAQWSVTLTVATAAASGTSGTDIGSVTLPKPAASTTGTGTREIYLGGSAIEGLVGDFATLEDPLYIRATATKTGTDASTIAYGAFLTRAN